jgi:hypothetical protein
LTLRFRHRRSSGQGGKPLGVGGKLGISLFFLLFFAMGMLFEVLTIREFGRVLGQRSWQRVPCRITRSGVQEQNDSEKPFVFATGFAYEYQGRSYTGSAYKRGYKGSETYSDAQKIARRYPVGLSLSCYVSPTNPAEAVLKRESLAMGLFIFLPLVFVLIGAGGLYGTWLAKPKAGKPIATKPIAGGKKGKYGLAAFFGIFAIAGLGMLYPLGIKPITKTLDARSWIETPCKVLRAEVRSHEGDDSTTYSVYIFYEYEFNDQTYQNDGYDFVGGSSSGYRSKARVVDRYRSAANPVCYVNPEDPADAVLKRGFHVKLLLALFPLPFLLVGLGGVYYTLRGKKAKAFRGAALLRPSDAGPAVLRPKHSPSTKLAIAILVALFWNGIISIMVVEVVGGFRHGQPNWFLTLFSVPFVAVGLGMLAYVVYQFLALFNPRPQLEVSSAAIPLGGAAELRWRLSGKVSRISELTVKLQGVEQATYRRGTRTYTDRNTFYEMELYRTTDTSTIASGHVGFVIPQDTMHSFEADNNKIIWSLEVRGDIKRWPDVKESFPISVVPAGC